MCGLAKSLGQVTLAVQIGNQTQSFTLTGDDWRELVVALPADLSPVESVMVTIKVDHLRVPAQINSTIDRRELGVLVQQIELR